jgi:RES domain-containing protein
VLGYFFYDPTLPWAKEKTFNPLGGLGAVYAAHRWNNAGHPMLYTSSSAALALWEVVVHTRLAGFGTRTLTEVSYSGKSIETVAPETVLALSRGGKHEEELTRGFGSDWLRDQRSLVLQVPSVIAPYETNIIFNPRHPEMKAVSSRTLGLMAIDQRFLKHKRP